ncbi:MAG: ECF transporter S component [Chloroflexi bacterium SZAS-1]|jgi:energy-coupling factor transport system substrate-specific component|nr:ECF transporter S component [Chloroflexi bacterium SZAS-1]HNP85213.1 LytS/YhcK type 5TM receptor domain-containing protein [Kouleothrix sp.]
MTTTRRGGLNSTALALIPLAIAINIAIGQLVSVLKLPLYLDSIGTVLTGALLGPWVGLITGALANIIWTLLGINPVAWWFAPVAAVIGLIAGFAGRAGLFQRSSPRWLSAIIGGVFLFALTLFIMLFINQTTDADGNQILPSAGELFAKQPIIFIGALVAGLALGYFVLKNAGYAGLAGLVTGVVAAIVSAPIAAYVFGGVTGGGTDALVAAFRASGANILASAFAQGTVSDPFDKMTSYMIVYLIIQSLPQRLLQRFPNARAAERNAMGQPVISR